MVTEIGIIKRLIESRQNVFLTDNFHNLFNLDFSEFIPFPDNVGGSNTDKINSLISLIDFLVNNRGKELSYYTFSIDKDPCVFLFSEEYMKISQLPSLIDYPPVQTVMRTDFTRKDEEGYCTYRIPMHTRILAAIRINNSKDKQYPVIIYSFFKNNFQDELNSDSKNVFFSQYFQINTHEEKTQKIFFYNRSNNELILKDLRKGILVSGFEWVATNKLDEYRYKLNAYHTRTIGSNNRDIDTTTTGVFNFLKNEWEEYDQKEERFKL